MWSTDVLGNKTSYDDNGRVTKITYLFWLAISESPAQSHQGFPNPTKQDRRITEDNL